jgi:hypothetical protein
MIMEDIEEKIKAIDLPSALKIASDSRSVIEYLGRIVINRGILDTVFLKQLNFQTIPPTTNLTPQEKSLLQLVNILFTTEGHFGGIVNLTIYALMVNKHHDVWNEWRQKFASLFEDILDIPLSVKMKFLKRHGFDFLCQACPRKLRNAIAHNSFLIQQDGSVRTMEKQTQTYTLAQLTEINQKMLEIGIIVTEIWSRELGSNELQKV